MIGVSADLSFSNLKLLSFCFVNLLREYRFTGLLSVRRHTKRAGENNSGEKQAGSSVLVNVGSEQAFVFVLNDAIAFTAGGFKAIAV